MLKSSSPDVIVEIMGLLGSLIIDDFDYAKLVQSYNLLGFVSKCLLTGSADSDVLLEAVILTGTLVRDENVIPLLLETNIVNSLLDILMSKFM